jgi:hypothetical protein
LDCVFRKQQKTNDRRAGAQLGSDNSRARFRRDIRDTYHWIDFTRVVRTRYARRLRVSLVVPHGAVVPPMHRLWRPHHSHHSRVTGDHGERRAGQLSPRARRAPDALSSSSSSSPAARLNLACSARGRNGPGVTEAKCMRHFKQQKLDWNAGSWDRQFSWICKMLSQ